MEKDKEIKEIINPQKTNIHFKSLQKRMRSSVTGDHSKFLINCYGCEKCILKENCEYYPHTNGICRRRSSMYAQYLRAGKGEVVPIMIDQLAKMSMERDIEHEKGMLEGKLTEEYFRLAHLCIMLQERIHKATEGTKLKVEHTHSWVDELRDAINPKKVVEVNASSNGSESEGQRKVPNEIPDRPAILRPTED